MTKKASQIIDDWCKETGLKVELTETGLKVLYNPKLERKGGYVQELDDLNNDLPIVNKGIVDYFTKGISPEETVNSCNELKQFQKVVKVSSNYKFGWYNGEKLTDKTFRVFASKDENDTYVGKCKYEGATIEKFADTSIHSFINNENVNGVPVPKKLDRKWYIDLIWKRIGDFGFESKKESIGLF